MTRISPWLFIGVIATLVYLISAEEWTRRVDTLYYDFLLRNDVISYDNAVIIVAIDEASLSQIGVWPWSRAVHTDLLSRLGQADAVFFDLIFAEPESPGARSNLSNADQLFAAAIEQHSRVWLPVYVSASASGFFPQEVLPVPDLANAAAGLGHIQLNFDDDGLARTIDLYRGVGDAFWPHLTYSMLTSSGTLNPARDHATDGRSQSMAPGTESDESGLDTLSDPMLIATDKRSSIRFVGGPGTVTTVSYHDVLRGRVPDSQWRDKTVFVGATAEGLGDYVPTPMGYMSGVEFNVNVYESIKQNVNVSSVPGEYLKWMHALVFIFSALLLVRLPPRSFLLGSIALGVIASIGSAAAFFAFDVWISITPFLIGLLVFYPLWSWRRIEIALRFLLDELSELNKSSSLIPPPGGEYSIQRQLDGLKKIAIIEKYSISKITGSGDDSSAGVERDDSAGVRVSSGNFLLDVQSNLPADKLRKILQATVSERDRHQDEEMESIELVERTIRNIELTQRQVDSVRARLDLSLARLQDAVVMADTAGRVVFHNEAAERMFDGIQMDQSIVDLQSSMKGNAWQGILFSLLVDDKSAYQELDLVNGSTVLCQASSLHDVDSSYSSGVVNYLLLVFTDVSSLRAAEQTKNEALAFLSHDMRSPIVSQLATIESVRQKGDLSELPSTLLSKLEQFGRKSLKYSEDFLQLSRAENLDKRSFHLVDVHSVIDGAVSQQQGFALQQGVTLKIERVKDDVWVEGDGGLLERAISNLISNAIQYCGTGKAVSILLRIENQVEIAVADQGPGIATEQMDKLFEPYFRSRRKRSHIDQRNQFGVQSYGLGLSFVRTVVLRHGGQLDVQSTLGEGSVFSVLLPPAFLE